MSTDAGIDFNFNKAIVPSSFITALLESGWGTDVDGSISLLSPKDYKFGSESDWETLDDVDTLYLLKWATFFDKTADSIGFLVVHQTTGIGGPMIISEDRNSLFWGISVNIPYLFPNRTLVDFSKCLSIIFPAISSVGLRIERVKMYAE